MVQEDLDGFFHPEFNGCVNNYLSDSVLLLGASTLTKSL